jgi:cytochrome c551/c552
MNDRHRQTPDLIAGAMSLVFLCVMITRPSNAASPAQADAAVTWREECGSCHIAYAPRLLPAASWRVLLARLDKHFGVDASLDPARLAVVRSYLEAQAGSPGRIEGSAVTPRISALPWFGRDHSEVPDQVWRRPSVRSRANCGACHTAAERGDFNEDGIRIPK